jgi:hypothetical protein
MAQAPPQPHARGHLRGLTALPSLALRHGGQTIQRADKDWDAYEQQYGWQKEKQARKQDKPQEKYGAKLKRQHEGPSVRGNRREEENRYDQKQQDKERVASSVATHDVKSRLGQHGRSLPKGELGSAMAGDIEGLMEAQTAHYSQQGAHGTGVALEDHGQGTSDSPWILSLSPSSPVAYLQVGQTYTTTKNNRDTGEAEPCKVKRTGTKTYEITYNNDPTRHYYAVVRD